MKEMCLEKNKEDDYRNEAERIVYGISKLGYYDRKWEIDKFRNVYSDNPAALDHFTEQLNAHVEEKLKYVEELQQRISEGGDEKRCYLGSLFETLILLGENQRLQKLVDEGADVEAKYWLTRPLHIAAGAQNTDAMEILINAGADVNAKDKETNTPLHWGNRCVAATALLLSHGAKPHEVNIDGNPPWRVASSEVQQVYLDFGFIVRSN